MIYLGNSPVGVAVQALGNGIKIRKVVVPYNITTAPALKTYIMGLLGENVDAIGINETVLGEWDSIDVNYYTIGFVVNMQNGEMDVKSGYIRTQAAGSTQAYQLQANWGELYVANLNAGDELAIYYKDKEVTANG